MNINLIKTSDINKINNLVKKDYFNIALGGNEDINRKLLENKKINMLLDPEPNSGDFMHYKNSGLNQVLVKIAKKNNIMIGFSLKRILEIYDKSSLLGKIMQNIVLCNKYQVKTAIVNLIDNEKDECNINDLKSLGLTLGILPGKINIIQEILK